MNPSRNFALYATVHRPGQRSEHRLAGARIRQVGVRWEWRLPHGWEATVMYGRLSVRVGLQLLRNDARAQDWIASLFPARVEDEAEGMFV